MAGGIQGPGRDQVFTAALSPSVYVRGLLCVGAAALCWSLGGLFFRALDLDAWTASFWRSLFAAGFLAAFASIPKRGRRALVVQGDMPHGCLIAVGIAVSMSTFLPALGSTSVANVAFIYAMAPIATAVLGHVWLGERLDRSTIVCAFIVMAGAALLFLSSDSRTGLKGDMLALASALALVFVGLGIRARPAHPLLAYVCLANILVAVVAACLAPRLAITEREAVVLAMFGFIQVALSFTLFTIGARLLPARDTALINALESPLSPLWVWLAFGETPSLLTVTSGVIIMTTVFAHIVLTTRRSNRDLAPLQEPVAALNQPDGQTV